jgi:hypothetical protein
MWYSLGGLAGNRHAVLMCPDVLLVGTLCVAAEEGTVSMAGTGLLDLDSLARGIPVINQDAAGFYKQNCMVCFQDQGHPSGVILSVDREGGSTSLGVHWRGSVNNQMRKAYGDLRKATEYAACAVALLLVRELTDFTAVEQAAIGTTVDYFLAPQVPDDTLIFNRAARLETSGILKEEGSNTVDRRAREKLQRLKPSSIPTVIAIVEFGSPKSKMVEP